MNPRTSKKILLTSFLFSNFIQPTRSADFQKINSSQNNGAHNLIWSKIEAKKKLSLPSNSSFSNIEKFYSYDNSPISNSKLLLDEISKKQNEIIIQSDKQTEVNDVIYAEGNVLVEYKGKFLKLII